MAALPELTYWDGHGDAELIRLMLAACGQQWLDKVALDEGSFLTTKEQADSIIAAGMLGFDEFPLLRADGLNLVDELSVVRYLARKHGRYGADSVEAAQIDVLSDGVRVLQTDDKAQHDAYLPRFDRALTGKQFLVGLAWSFVDVQLFKAIDDMVAAAGRQFLKQYPAVMTHYDKMISTPELLVYLTSGQRFVRPGRDGYLSRVQACTPYAFNGRAQPMTSARWNYKDGADGSSQPLKQNNVVPNHNKRTQLTYWHKQGSAELIRLMLTACREEWDDRVALEPEAQFVAAQPQADRIAEAGFLAFDQLPLLQIDGLNLVQQHAAVRYLARKHSLYGANNGEAAQLDIISDSLLKFKKGDKRHQEHYLPRLERALGGKNFLLGPSMTFVDLQLFQVIDDIIAEEGRPGLLAPFLAPFPELTAHYARMLNDPRLAAYMASDRRIPRQGTGGSAERECPEDRPCPMSSDTWHFRIPDAWELTLPAGMELRPFFASMDGNADNTISMSEWLKAFDMLDTNHNNAISRKEWQLLKGDTKLFDSITRKHKAVITRNEWKLAFESISCNADMLGSLGTMSEDCGSSALRLLSLPYSIQTLGSAVAWNKRNYNLHCLQKMLGSMCQATTVSQALNEVKAMMQLGHNIWAYAYMRVLFQRNKDLYYGVIHADLTTLLSIISTPTISEACQKFGKMPFYPHGCYVSVKDRGKVKKVLEEYANAELDRGPQGTPVCDCIVFSDGGNLLGGVDLGSWGMAVPISKLDLLTACGGFDPRRTIPVIIDVGCAGVVDKEKVRDHSLYTGVREDRATHRTSEGTVLTSAHHGPGNLIKEFIEASVQLFGRRCLLQFEDFDPSDAVPLLQQYRDTYVTCNENLQGTSAAIVAALLGAVRLRNPACKDLFAELKKETILFHGAGHATIGALSLLEKEMGMSKAKLFFTAGFTEGNGTKYDLIWKDKDGKGGNAQCKEQREYATVGKPSFDTRNVVRTVKALKATCVVGNASHNPGCFNDRFVQAVEDNARQGGHGRPVVLALSSPKAQVEITAKDAYTWSKGSVIYGSSVTMEPTGVAGKLRCPGQVNSAYIFPGLSMGVVASHAHSVPDRLFLVAAEAVARSLDEDDIKADRVVPHPDRLREVGLNVAAAVAAEVDRLGLSEKLLCEDKSQVREAIRKMMWSPDLQGEPQPDMSGAADADDADEGAQDTPEVREEAAGESQPQIPPSSDAAAGERPEVSDEVHDKPEASDEVYKVYFHAACKEYLGCAAGVLLMLEHSDRAYECAVPEGWTAPLAVRFPDSSLMSRQQVILFALGKRLGLYPMIGEDEAHALETTMDAIDAVSEVTAPQPDGGLDQIVLRWLALFEASLKATGTGFTVGSSLTYTDFAVFAALLTLQAAQGLAVLDDSAADAAHPHVSAFMDTMRSLPKVGELLAQGTPVLPPRA